MQGTSRAPFVQTQRPALADKPVLKLSRLWSNGDGGFSDLAGGEDYYMEPLRTAEASRPAPVKRPKAA